MRGRAVAVALLTMATSCASLSTLATRQDGTITKAGRISVFALRPGDCLLPDGVVGGDVDEVKAVPCAEPHTHEVFAVARYTATATYPGRPALERFAGTTCRRELTGYVDRTAAADPSLSLSYLVPSRTSWREDRDRQITCVLVASGNKMAGSVRTTTTTTGTR